MQTTKSWQTGLTVWITIVMISFAFTATAMNAAAEEVTYEGTIQGLNCTYYSRECPKDDLDIYAALENDFVLVLPDGKFFSTSKFKPSGQGETSDRNSAHPRQAGRLQHLGRKSGSQTKWWLQERLEPQTPGSGYSVFS